jgi:peroxiredoxin
MTLALSAPCPPFELPGTDGNVHSLASFDGKILVVIVSCNHCPYVVAWEPRMVSIANAYLPKGVAFIAVNANDTRTHASDGMEPMKQRAKERGFPFPYVRDDSQDVARALGARVTPEVFVFDREKKLRYHGRIDDNHRDAASVRSHDLKNALDALLRGDEPPVTETPPVGCSVKWKS